MSDLSNTVDSMLKAIEKINLTLYPFSMILPAALAALFIAAFILNMRKPNYANSVIMKLTIMFCYFFAGIPLFFTIPEMGSSAIVGGSILTAIGLLFGALIFDKKMLFAGDERIAIRIVASVLMITGIFLYPAIELLTGFSWPGMVFFGAECPTTITVIGLLILTMKRMPKFLMIILFANAAFTGTSVALNGAPFDWSYAIAGYTGILLLILNWKSIRRETT